MRILVSIMTKTIYVLVQPLSLKKSLERWNTENTLCILPVRIIGEKKMPEHIENRMVVDSEWGEIEYGVPSPTRIRRYREAYEEAERKNDERFKCSSISESGQY